MDHGRILSGLRRIFQSIRQGAAGDGGGLDRVPSYCATRNQPIARSCPFVIWSKWLPSLAKVKNCCAIGLVLSM